MTYSDAVAEVLSFGENRGLRAAIAAGYGHAAEQGYEYCGRVDADGPIGSILGDESLMGPHGFEVPARLKAITLSRGSGR